MRLTQENFVDLLNDLQNRIKAIFPVSGQVNTISVSDLRWDGVDLDVYRDPEIHKKAKTHGRTLAARLLATVTITNKLTKKLADSERNYPILAIPHITNKQSFIVQGKEVQIVNQIRLKPGTYTRYTADNNVETFINTAGGGYRIQFDRISQIFRIRVGQSTYVYLYPVLKILGVSDYDLSRIWGNEILASNKPYDNIAEVRKLYHKLRPYSPVPENPIELGEAVKSFFGSKPLDPNVTKLTIGQAFSRIEPKVLASSSERALRLARGETKADDTENLAYKSLHSVEDFIKERIEQNVAAATKFMTYQVDKKPVVNDVLPPSLFTAPVMKFFTASEFSRYSDQSNPLDMFSVASLVTSMGEGGISSTHAVTDNVRSVHPSHVGVLDPVETPESSKIGITGHLALGARKLGTDLGLVVIDAKTGKRVTKKVAEIEDKVVAFNDQYVFGPGKPQPNSSQVKARAAGQFKTVPASSVEYIFDMPEKQFSSVSNAIPFLHTNDPNRALLASRHLSQAVALKDPDAPLVQSRFGTKGFENVVGANLTAQAPVDGVVTVVRSNEITIRGSDRKTHTVKLHIKYPLNSNTFLDEKPIVKAGDRVKAGQPIADSDFTRNGALTIGKTLITAYLPYKGYNFEDGIVVSESAAKKLTSVHKHEMRLDLDPTIQVGIGKLLAHFPSLSEGLDRAKYEADGVVKKGAILNLDDIAIPAVRQVKVYEDFDYTKLHKSLQSQWLDVSVRWDGANGAEVVDVVKTRTFITIYVRTEEPLEIGDKLSHRAGGKGIVTLILPDNEMYRDSKGRTVDALFNPTGVLGRINPGQYFEAAAGKIAEKTGKPYLVSNFRDQNIRDNLLKQLKEHGLSDTETLTDPVTNKQLPDIMTGNVHFMKLRHQVSKKLSARGVTSYTHDETPSRQAQSNPMAIGNMELYSLLSGGGTAFLRDASLLKGAKNDEYWRALQLGLPTPPLQTPFIVDKFSSYMRGAGINLKQEGKSLKALPMTDKDILAQSNGEILSPGAVKADNLAPELGGLFDPALTGGFAGTYWNHIALESPIPNPLMDHAIIGVLSTPAKPFKRQTFDDIVNGRVFVTPKGEITNESKGNLTGGAALEKLLSFIDVDKEVRALRVDINTLRGTRRDVAIKKLRYLTALQQAKLSPNQAYINRTVPVVPAKMRPIYPNPDGTLNISDVVHGYREVLLVNNQLKDLKKLGVDDKNLAPLRAQLYGAARGLVGLQEPLTRGKDFRGFLSIIKGQENKFGLFQGRVLKRRQDLTGRSTIIPDPKLGLDSVKIPDVMAYTIYKPFLIRRLGELGYAPLAAREMVEKRDKMATAALEAEIKERPVILNRAPSLHKFSLLALKPELTPGKAIEINPLVIKGFGADFDGDAMQVHIPVSEEARNEALNKLLPSKNLFSPRDNSVVHLPTNETVLGIYLMTTPTGDAITAKTTDEVLKLYRAGKIKVNQAAKVGQNIICAGQIILNDAIPKEQRPGLIPVNKKKLYEIIQKVAREKTAIAGQVISALKDLGNKYVTEIGWSFSLRDLQFSAKTRDAIMDEANKRTKTVGFGPAHLDAMNQLQAEVAKETNNRLLIGGPISGAMGKLLEITKTIASPVASTDHEGKIIPISVNKSFAEGLDTGSYWTLIPGARKGLMFRSLSTQDTGAFSKRLLSVTVGTMITMRDCGTKTGLVLGVDDPDALDRVIADGAYVGKITTPQLLRNMKARGKKTVLVRSPLRCQAHDGLCALCFGPLENGQLPEIGYHIGALAGQTISEPATQLTLKAFHMSGTIGTANIGFPRLAQILEMPTNVKGKAVLSKMSGAVTAIKPSAAGGWLVTVDNMEHFVPQEQGLGVKKGAVVKAGDLLSSGGVIKPQDVLETTGDMHRVQSQMIKDMRDVFSASSVNIKRKILETAIQPMTNRAQVDDPGDAVSEGVMQGDVMTIAKIDSMNKELKKKGKKPILYTPTLLSMRQAPYYSDDFIGQLVAERPHMTLKKAPALGSVSNIGPDGHPIATYAFGKFFGTSVKENQKKTAQELTQDIDTMIETSKAIEAAEPEESLPKEISSVLVSVKKLL